jgi:hypothetical protein
MDGLKDAGNNMLAALLSRFDWRSLMIRLNNFDELKDSRIPRLAGLIGYEASKQGRKDITTLDDSMHADTTCMSEGQDGTTWTTIPMAWKDFGYVVRLIGRQARKEGGI